jgi:hypothetical protein
MEKSIGVVADDAYARTFLPFVAERQIARVKWGSMAEQ